MSLPRPDGLSPATTAYLIRLVDEIERRLAVLEAPNKTPFVVLSGTASYTPGTYTFDVAGTSLAATNAALGTLIAVLKKNKRVR